MNRIMCTSSFVDRVLNSIANFTLVYAFGRDKNIYIILCNKNHNIISSTKTVFYFYENLETPILGENSRSIQVKVSERRKVLFNDITGSLAHFQLNSFNPKT